MEPGHVPLPQRHHDLSRGAPDRRRRARPRHRQDLACLLRQSPRLLRLQQRGEPPLCLPLAPLPTPRTTRYCCPGSAEITEDRRPSSLSVAGTRLSFFSSEREESHFKRRQHPRSSKHSGLAQWLCTWPRIAASWVRVPAATPFLLRFFLKYAVAFLNLKSPPQPILATTAAVAWWSSARVAEAQRRLPSSNPGRAPFFPLFCALTSGARSSASPRPHHLPPASVASCVALGPQFSDPVQPHPRCRKT